MLFTVFLQFSLGGRLLLAEPAHGQCDSSTPLIANTVLRPARDPPATQRLDRSEEHTSELQSRLHLVCRLLLEKKKKIQPSALPSFTLTLISHVTVTLLVTCLAHALLQYLRGTSLSCFVILFPRLEPISLRTAH